MNIKLDAEDSIESKRENQFTVNNMSNYRFTKNIPVKYLLFFLEKDCYALPLSSVKEVIGILPITAIPHMPFFFKGVINLKGRIISILDLRIWLGLPEKAFQAKKNAIIITNVNDLILGIIVDDVYEAVDFNITQIERRFNLSSKIGCEYISGAVKAENGSLTLILDIGKMLNIEELELYQNKGK